MNGHCRKYDPATSAMAAEAMSESGSLERQLLRCLAEVTKNPGLTAREIEERIGVKAHKRLPELRQRGLVCNGQVRRCRVSGRAAMTWHVCLKDETCKKGVCVCH